MTRVLAIIAALLYLLICARMDSRTCAAFDFLRNDGGSYCIQ